MSKANVKPVLLTNKQIESIRQLQERQRSAFGTAPTIHEIARGLMDKALQQIEGAM
ncbi:hypothetical protein ACN09C_07025 [Serratia fonticola]|uniref:hypothetical protein n=1 Tax=Serratia fonticola TaxID=47917 RepID=UPI003AFFDEF3